jgi:hypothetical membrane protein
MAINFINRGLLSLAFATGLSKAMRSNGESATKYRTGIALLWIWGVGALLLGIFPTDVPSTPASWHGLIHLVVATLAFIGGGLGTLALSLRIREGNLPPSVKRFSLATSSLAVAFLLLTLTSLQTEIGGLIERTFIGLVLLWIFVMSLVFRQMPRHDDLEQEDGERL